MKNVEKKIIFFFHLNSATVDKNIIPVYFNTKNKQSKYPSLICKIRNKLLKTLYMMYLIDFQISNYNKDLYFFLQVNKNLKFNFDININKDYFDEKNKNKYYFYFEKIVFKDGIKNSNIIDKIFNKNKDTKPPFSIDINIFEQAQLIVGYINSIKRKEQFELLQSLKSQLGLAKFSRLTELFLMYLKFIFVDNYNTELIQKLLSQYKFINFDVKPSFNYSLFFDSFIKPIFLKPYKERNFFVYNNFEYDLRNCLTSEYNRIFDKLCLKYYIYYDKDFLMNENNFKSRIITNEEKNQFYKLLYEVFYELNLYQNCEFLQNNNYLRKDFIKEIFITKVKEINELKNKGNNEIIKRFNINNFNSLIINQLDNNNLIFECFGKINNGFWVRRVENGELYIYDEILEIKKVIDFKFSNDVTSFFQMKDGNIIIVYKQAKKICIIEIKNFYNPINQVYKFPKIGLYEDYFEQSNFFIIKAIEINNKNIIILTQKDILFYYNKIVENNENVVENSLLYDFSEYARIKQKDGDINLSLLEFNNNYIIILSGKNSNNNNRILLNTCYLTFINIIHNKNNKNLFAVESSKFKIKGFEFIKYNLGNNILMKLSDDILAIGSDQIYLYTLKYKEIFKIVEIPTFGDFNRKKISSFFLSINQIIYIAVNYFDFDEGNTQNFFLTETKIKFYIYCFLEKNALSNEKELIFLSEAIPDSQEPFINAIEV